MENWTGIVKGTNNGVLTLQFEYINETTIAGTFTLIDADTINVTAKVEGHKDGNIIKGNLLDFEPKAEGVPTKGDVELTLSEDETKMEGTWQTDVGTKGDCVLYRSSSATPQQAGRQSPQSPQTTLEKNIPISFRSFERDDIKEIFSVVDRIAVSIKASGRSCKPHIYTITYDEEEKTRTYELEEFLDKLDAASKIWFVGFEFTYQSDIEIQNIYINIFRQEAYNVALKSNALIQSTSKDTMGVIPEAIRGLISKTKKRSRFWHSSFSDIVVQLSGVIIMIVFSFLISKKIASSLATESKTDTTYMLIIFIISLIVVSNLWVYISRGIFVYIHKTFPVVEIISKKQNKAISNIVFNISCTCFGALTLYCFGMVIEFIKFLLSS
ncbi:MAG: hypothetical protein FVQ80_02380 [Planctomycetes bacterium]|nr:hypothetical protein [Planctomycetota bacterium]